MRILKCIPLGTSPFSNHAVKPILDLIADSSVVSNNKKCRSPGGGIDQRESKPIEANPTLNKVDISTSNDLIQIERRNAIALLFGFQSKINLVIP